MPQLKEAIASVRIEKGVCLSFSQLHCLNDDQKARYLLDQWGMDTQEITGRVIQRNGIWWLDEATNASGEALTYPIEDLRVSDKNLRGGIYIGKELSGFEHGQYVSASFELARRREREKKKNPLLISIVPTSIRRLRHIPPSAVYRRDDGSVDIDATLTDQYWLAHSPQLIQERDRLEQRIAELEAKATDLNSRNAAAAENVREAQKAAKEIEDQLRAAEKDTEQQVAQLHAEIEAKRQKEEQELEHLKTRLAVQRGEAHKTHNLELARLAQDRTNAQESAERIMDQTERLRTFARERADRLYQLDFITKDQYDDLLGVRPQPGEAEKDWPTFGDLENGYAGLVSHIQRYLFEKRIVYPRALLENFVTLLRTGDLIILSGLSGSGKTQLVKAFAEATGNAAHIVPVKPNWTSSEDLLGYYNPLQRSYLTTPFLDALIAAKRDPEHLHLICLDEMNLARVEYYFADFLSALEERRDAPCIKLYSEEEAGHVEAEFRMLVGVVLDAAEGKDLQRIGDFLLDKEVMERLRISLGLDKGESFVEMHSRLRRMVTGVLNVPASLRFPNNVRVIGAVNIDETTHNLSPKVLDRVHVVQFQSPLTYWELVKKEVQDAERPVTPIRVPAAEFTRPEYPPYDPEQGDEIADRLRHWAKEYLRPMGIDIGLRTIRQALLYRDQLRDVMEGDVGMISLNNVLRQKLLPRFSFEGKQRPRADSAKETCTDLIQAFQKEVEQLPDFEPFNAKRELKDLIARAEAADMIFNYWA